MVGCVTTGKGPSPRDPRCLTPSSLSVPPLPARSSSWVRTVPSGSNDARWNRTRERAYCLTTGWSQPHWRTCARQSFETVTHAQSSLTTVLWVDRPQARSASWQCLMSCCRPLSFRNRSSSAHPLLFASGRRRSQQVTNRELLRRCDGMMCSGLSSWPLSMPGTGCISITPTLQCIDARSRPVKLQRTPELCAPPYLVVSWVCEGEGLWASAAGRTQDRRRHRHRSSRPELCNRTPHCAACSSQRTCRLLPYR